MKSTYWEIREKYEKELTPYGSSELCYYCKHFNKSTNECLNNSNRAIVKPDSPACAKINNNYYEYFYRGLYYTAKDCNKLLSQEIKRLNTLKDKRNKEIKNLKMQLKEAIKA